MFRVKELLLSGAILESPLVRLHLWCFRLYGYVASKYQRRPWLSLLRCIFFTASFWMCCVLMLVRVFQGYDRLNDGATTCATALQYLTVSVATLNAIVQRTRVVSMLREIHEDMQKLIREADDQEMDIVVSAQKYTRTITLIVWIPSIVAGLMAWLDCIYRTFFMPHTVFNMPAVRRGEEQSILLFKLFPFGELYDNFVVGYLGPWYALALGITTIPLWHTFIMCLMKYVHLKLLILNKRVSEMDTMRLNMFLDLDLLTPAQLSRWRMRLLAKFLADHLKIRRFVKELELLIRVPVMIDFIIFSILICFLFYALRVGSPTKMDCFFMCIYIFVMTAILFVYHWHATLITECHVQLAFALYSTPWYEYERPVQRMILIMMIHAQRPLGFRALMIPVNLNTFLDIVQAAYSYSNLLSQLY